MLAFSPIWAASLRRWRSPPDNVVSGWPQAQIAKSDVGESVQDLAPRGLGVGGILDVAGKEGEGLIHRHREHLADVASAELVVEDPGRNRRPRTPHTASRRRPSWRGRCR